MEGSSFTIADLVRNGTMSADMAALLWAAVDEQASFLTVAIPRMAGKSTTSRAVLGLRRPDVPVHRVAGDHGTMQRLREQRLGGYLVVEELSPWAGMPGYIWGEPVRRVFDTLGSGYSLQTALHAPGPEEGIMEVTQGNRIPDDLASVFKLVLYIERFGSGMANFWRRLTNLYEVDRIENGRPIGHSIFQWRPDGDRFEQVSEPHHFHHSDAELRERAGIIGELARSGRTSPADVAGAVQAYRSR